jgi:predicted permease
MVIQAANPFVMQSLQSSSPLVLDYRLFAFAAVIALGVALLVGALPSLQTSAGNLEQVLRQAGRGTAGAHNQGIRRYIVIAEIALSLVLVCGAFLLFKSLLNLQQIETGVRIENVITMSLDLPAKTYPTPVRAAMFYESARERIRGVPGVQQAAFSTHLPLRWIGNGEFVEVAGVKQPINVRFKRVDSGYFDIFGIPLLAGRGINDPDRHGGRRVVVINEALGKRLADVAGLHNPIGRIVRINCPHYSIRAGATEEVEIIGMIRSERVAEPGVPDPAVVYVPIAQVPNQGVSLIVRTQSDPSSVISGIREAMRGIDPNLPVGDIATMQEIREQTLSGSSRPAWVIGAFAAIAAFLTAMGLYGVLSQMVTQRRREIGIRMALGAGWREVVVGVMRNGLFLVMIGLVLGIFGVFGLTRVMKTLLYEVSPLDPSALAVACVSMTVIGLLAGFVPAMRAARVDPVTTLRDEG